MELRHLRYFVAVAEVLNFTRAASGLIRRSLRSASRSSIWNGPWRPALDRSKRHVALTEGGKVFLADAKELLAGLDRAVERAALAQQGNPPNSRRNCARRRNQDPAEADPLTGTKLPKVRLVFIICRPRNKNVCSRLDRWTWSPRGPLQDPRLEVEDVLWEKLLVGLPAKHPLARKKSSYDSTIKRGPLYHGLARRLAGIARRGTRLLREPQACIPAWCNRPITFWGT